MACQRRITNRVVAGNSTWSDGASRVGETTVASGLITRESVLVALPSEALTVVLPVLIPRTVNPAVLAPAGIAIVEGVARIEGSVLLIVIVVVVVVVVSKVAVRTSDSPTKIVEAEAVRLSKLTVDGGGGVGPGGVGDGGGDGGLPDTARCAVK